MPTYRYRAATPTGAMKTGALEGVSAEAVIAQLRRMGLSPIEAVIAGGGTRAATATRADGRARRAVATAIGELAVLLEAGLTLDRALAVCADNILHPGVKAAFGAIHAQVKAGVALSRAMAESKVLFPPMASAMCEAGEADGRLGAALSRLAESLERSEALRETVVSALIYPGLLTAVASSVILVMLLVVVPQFEGLFSGSHDKLPLATRLVMAASDGLRAYGLAGLGVIVAAGFALRQWMRRPAVRRAFDRLILDVPLLGPLIVNAETAAFARTLGSLVEGGVPLPTALSIAQRSVSNRHMADAIAKVAAGLKEGAGLSRSLAASGVLPPMALSFLRTGEETARLGMMLGRLAEVMDRTVRSTIQRLIGILTPAITVVMGAVVATVIASIMSAILGFNDLALSP